MGRVSNMGLLLLFCTHFRSCNTMRGGAGGRWRWYSIAEWYFQWGVKLLKQLDWVGGRVGRVSNMGHLALWYADIGGSYSLLGGGGGWWRWCGVGWKCFQWGTKLLQQLDWVGGRVGRVSNVGHLLLWYADIWGSYSPLGGGGGWWIWCSVGWKYFQWGVKLLEQLHNVNGRSENILQVVSNIDICQSRRTLQQIESNPWFCHLVFFRGSERYIQGVVIVAGWRRQIHLARSRWYTFNLLTSFWIESLTAGENFLSGGASSSMRKTNFWLSSVNSLCFSVFWKWVVVDHDVNDILASRRRRRNLVSLKVRFGPFWLFLNGLNWQEIRLTWISY